LISAETEFELVGEADEGQEAVSQSLGPSFGLAIRRANGMLL